jgi:SPRY domain
MITVSDFTGVAIQAAIADGVAAGGADIYFPDGIYDVDDVLQDASRSNAQILLPRIMTDSTTEPLSIRLFGSRRPAAQPSVVGGAGLPSHGAVIRSTLGAGGGALLGAWGPSGSASDFSYCRVELQNLTFRMPANSTRSAVDLSHVTACSIDGVCIDAGEYGIPSIAAQTTATSWGLRLPANNNGASVDLGRLDVIGFYNGLEVGEHTCAKHVATWGCTNAVTLPFAHHASHFQRLMIAHCKRGLKFAGSHVFRIDQLDVEHAASGTWAPVHDIDDPSNYGRGSLSWHTVLAFSGNDNTFLVNGGTGIKRTRLYDDAAPVPPSSTIWNPSDTHSDISLSGGSLVATKGVSNSTRSTRATRGIVSSANGYFEVLMGGSETTANYRLVGVSTLSFPVTTGPGADVNSWGYYEQTGQKYTGNALSSYGSTFANGDVIGVAFKNGKVWFAKNNVWQGGGNPAAGTGEAFSGITGTIYPTVSLYKGTPSPVHVATARFRSADFSYAPPSGFDPWG